MFRFGVGYSFRSPTATQNKQRASKGAQLGTATVAQTGSLPYRGLAIRQALKISAPCRMPFGDTADSQSALHSRTSVVWWQCRDAPVSKARDIYRRPAARP